MDEPAKDFFSLKKTKKKVWLTRGERRRGQAHHMDG
jgi:hypothetical protein